MQTREKLRMESCGARCVLYYCLSFPFVSASATRDKYLLVTVNAWCGCLERWMSRERKEIACVFDVVCVCTTYTLLSVWK